MFRAGRGWFGTRAGAGRVDMASENSVNRTLATALTGGAALVLALTGCTGDDGAKERDAWARKVCDRVGPQVRKIQQANASIAKASEGGRSSKEVKEIDSTAFQDISEAYQALADAVQRAGEPPVDDGATLHRDAVRELKSLSRSYSELKKTVDKLDTDDQGEFAEGLKKVAGRLEKLGDSGDEALNTLQSGELGQAMAKQKGCRSTSGGGKD